MPQPHPQNSGPSPKHRLFSPGATSAFRLGIILALLLTGGGAGAVFAFYHSPWWTREGFAPNQPVLFSHRHHAGELRIDCRFCHTGVESSAFAGLPSTETCLTCHSQIFTDTAMLRPVVRSAETGLPLRWKPVTNLPGYVYFNHSIHIAKGVGCTTCHGDIGTMALTAKGERLDMRWCLDCHRDPGTHLSPREDLYAASWRPTANARSRPAALMRAYEIHSAHLTDCVTCHR